MLRFCKDSHMSIINLRIQSQEDHPRAKYAAEIKLRGSVDSQPLADRIRLMPGIVSVMIL